MNKGERVWDPETSGGIVFDGDVPIVTGRETEKMIIMICIQGDENMEVYFL